MDAATVEGKDSLFTGRNLQLIQAQCEQPFFQVTHSCGDVFQEFKSALKLKQPTLQNSLHQTLCYTHFSNQASLIPELLHSEGYSLINHLGDNVSISLESSSGMLYTTRSITFHGDVWL